MTYDPDEEIGLDGMEREDALRRLLGVEDPSEEAVEPVGEDEAAEKQGGAR